MSNYLTDLSQKRLDIVQITSVALKAIRRYTKNNHYQEVVDLPMLGSFTLACEDINNLFKANSERFKEFLVLAQSDQLYLEMLTPKFGKVCGEIMSSRAEDRRDGRHLAHFKLYELEILGGLDNIITEISNVVNAMRQAIAFNCQEQLQRSFDLDWHTLVNPVKFARISYQQALSVLNEESGTNLVFGDDLKHDHELFLANKFGPLFITHYPKEIKFFNMKINERDSRLVNSTDLILPKSGESCGASEREHRYEPLKEKLQTSTMLQQVKDMGGSEQLFDWYIEHHKNNDIPLHSGCGLGIPRILQYILNQDNIEDVVAFPITKGRIY